MTAPDYKALARQERARKLVAEIDRRAREIGAEPLTYFDRLSVYCKFWIWSAAFGFGGGAPSDETWRLAREILRARLPPPALVHSRDADCDVDPETDCCRACGVLHGDPCPRCAGRAFHDEGAHP